jgi:hypothetical protein
MAFPNTLIDPKLVYLEPDVRTFARGQEILTRFPDAERVEVASHWKITELSDPALADDWLRVKRDILVLGVKKGRYYTCRTHQMSAQGWQGVCCHVVRPFCPALPQRRNRLCVR